MKIVGFQKVSMVDYPGKIASVVFTPGCNMNCYYCHNRIILGADADRTETDPEEILGYLLRRRGLLDGLVVTGGEPTLQRDLRYFIRDVKELGYPVKLDTNGTNPVQLRALVEDGLVDYVAMDLKAPRQRYEEICGATVDLDAIEESIRFLMEGKIPYEFRTTFSPELTKRDVVSMAGEIRGARRLVLQQYRVPDLTLIHDVRLDAKPHSAQYITDTAEEITSLDIPCFTRGL